MKETGYLSKERDLNRCLVSVKNEAEDKELKATGERKEIQLSEELKETQEVADYKDVPVSSEINGKELVNSVAEEEESTSYETKVRKKKRKSSKSRGKKKLDQSSLNTEEAGISSIAQHTPSEDAEIFSEKVKNSEVSNKINTTNRDEENDTAGMKEKVNFTAADQTLTETNKDTESEVRYDDHTEYILNEIAKAVADNDIGFWKSEYIRENIYYKGGIARKQYDEMRRVHCPV